MIEASEGISLAQVDVLGASLAQRTSAALLTAGVSSVTVLSADDSGNTLHNGPGSFRYVKSTPEELWRDGHKLYETLADEGADTLVIIRLTSYCEIDWKRLLVRHQASAERLTRVWGSASAPLDIYVVDPRFNRDTRFLFHSRLTHSRLAAGRYQATEDEYVHGLHTPRDLREIAVDALNLRCAMRPVGRELRPGIWRAEGSRVDAGVRLVAPVYIGKRTRVRTGAVITRGSALEHHSSVDCGTVIENTTVLPYATVGAGLDLSQTIVGNHQVIDLKRNVAVDIYDRTLLDEAAHNTGVRLVSKAAALATYLPMQFWRGLTQRHALPEMASAGDVCADLKSLNNEKKPVAPALRPGFAMERYGNQ